MDFAVLRSAQLSSEPGITARLYVTPFVGTNCTCLINLRKAEFIAWPFVSHSRAKSSLVVPEEVTAMEGKPFIISNAWLKINSSVGIKTENRIAVILLVVK